MSSLSDIQIYAALLVALIPGVLALRLSTELYK
ncbi:MAG: photosystem I reaction center subunit XII [Tatlockia sp.]|jgi:photosystem I subunit 12|nr:photosystem I reaction center subunit XII [Chlorogloea sp. CCALA 695]MBA2748841.1 photosystem I reaction center subunit XII [Tatlockia sp.]PSB32863.1 photosystem I reaction center subunit XII [Chlorogloea sp. CCALA 695]